MLITPVTPAGTAGARSKHGSVLSGNLHPGGSVLGETQHIEDSFETAKNELGLDHNETRSWHGWHRHVSLVMLAFAMMASIRQEASVLNGTPKKTSALRRWSAGPFRKSGASRHGLHDDG